MTNKPAAARVVLPLPPNQAPTREAIAAYATPILGPTTKRAVEKWPLPYRRLGRRLVATGWDAVQAHVRTLIEEAPIVDGRTRRKPKRLQEAAA